MKTTTGAALAAFAAAAMTALWVGGAGADTIRVAGIYTQPIQQKWDARLHQALTNAQNRGDIEYSFSEKVSNTDYIRVLREYAESGVELIVGEAFGISREAREVADDYPEVAFLMGDPFGPHGSNFAVFDNWIHEPCYLMGIIAGTMTESNRIGMVGGYPIGEVNRLFHAFMNGARSVNSEVEFKVTFIGSWYDPPKAKEAAFAQIEAGVDVLYAERAGVVDARPAERHHRLRQRQRHEQGGERRERRGHLRALGHEPRHQQRHRRSQAGRVRGRQLQGMDDDAEGRREPRPLLRVRGPDPGRCQGEGRGGAGGDPRRRVRRRHQR